MNALLLGDLTTCLQLAGAWLDPLTTDDMLDSEEGDTLNTLRDHRPEQYASYLWHTYEGGSEMQVDLQVERELNDWLPYEGEFMELSSVSWGLPVTFWGCGLYDEGFSDCRSGVVEMASLFLLHNDDTRKDYAHAAHWIMRQSDDLEASDDLACALAWLFGSSGNTVLDMSFEEGHENGLGAADWDRLEFITEMHHEAEIAHSRAMNAFRQLEDSDDLYSLFCGDLVRAYWRAIEEAHNVYSDCTAYTRTILGDRRAECAADPEPDVHAVWDRAA